MLRFNIPLEQLPDTDEEPVDELPTASSNSTLDALPGTKMSGNPQRSNAVDDSVPPRPEVSAVQAQARSVFSLLSTTQQAVQTPSDVSAASVLPEARHGPKEGRRSGRVGDSSSVITASAARAVSTTYTNSASQTPPHASALAPAVVVPKLQGPERIDPLHTDTVLLNMYESRLQEQDRLHAARLQQVIDLAQSQARDQLQQLRQEHASMLQALQVCTQMPDWGSKLFSA